MVANGRTFYEQVLADPIQFPAGYSFEKLLVLAAQAYEQRTGMEYYPAATSLSYETYSNQAAWAKKQEG